MNKVYLVLALILALGAAGAAQQKKTHSGSVNSSSSGSGSASSNSSVSRNGNSGNSGGRSLMLDSATSITGELQSTLDAKRAQVGDEVILKTMKAIKQNGETIIPKGSSLIGHVTEVQQRTRGNATSKLGLVFDRVEGKNLSADVVATVVSITNLQAANNVGDVFGSDVTGSSSTSASGSARGSARGSGGSSGGGLLGGGSGGGLLGGVGNTVGGVVNGATQTVGGVANTATQTVGGVTNTATQTLGSTTQGIGQTINGIQISQSASGSANGSTMLSSQNKNVKLDKGVTFNLQLSGNANANAN